MVAIIFFIPVFFVIGCSMDLPIIKEMNAAYVTVVKQGGDSYVDRDLAVSNVVRKYLPIGAKTEDAIELLEKLNKRGFRITELRHEGTRIWPEKELTQYWDATREHKYPVGTTGYSAKKDYVTSAVIITKTVVITIKLDENGTVVESEGKLYSSGI